MNERKIIIGVLRGLGRRLWINRALQEVAFAVCVILFCLVCFNLVERTVVSYSGYAGPAICGPLLFALVAVTVGIAGRCAHGVSTRQAAAVADARAHLKDELKSAHWFMSELPTSPLLQLQLQHAAATAAKLDLAVLAPRKLPVSAAAAGGLGFLLAALIWMTPQLSNPRELGHESGTATAEEPADLLLLLKDVPREAAVEKLDLALRKLQQTDASADEKRQALAEARDAIDQANMEASAAREALATLAEALISNPNLESVSQALDQGRVDDAVALLRKLKADPAATAEPEKHADDPAERSSAQDTNMRQALETAGRDLAGSNAVINQEAIDRATKAIEQANERIEVQGRVNIVKRRMEANLVATNQRSQLTASQFDNRSNAPNPTPSPDTGSSNLRGGTLFRQAAIAREEENKASDGSQTGDASGDSVALPLGGAATRRLDVHLKLETILQRDRAAQESSGKGDPGWFNSASREQKSSLPTEHVRSVAGYRREDALNHDRVPVRQKNIVKNYFLNLHESENR